jgi:3-deoxy-manno-octulosonate cytidylyltransferase (CMP-KDO synthetase)
MSVVTDQVKVVIPARYDSTRLPGKPLLELNGFPIVWHVYQRVLEAGIQNRDVVIATDDRRISSMANELDLNVQMTSSKHASGTDRVNEVAEISQWSDSTIVLNVQGDEPLIPANLIKSLVSFSFQHSEFDITTAVTPIRSFTEMNNPNIVKAIMCENDRALYFTRAAAPYNRQDEKDISQNSYRHIGIYAYRRAALRQFCQFPESRLENCEKLEQLRALSYGLNIGALCFDQAPPHGVDTMSDYQNLINLMDKH